MPRLMSTKRYRKLVDAERRWNQRPAIIPDNKIQHDLEERLRIAEGGLLDLARFFNPSVSTISEALEQAAKLKKK